MSISARWAAAQERRASFRGRTALLAEVRSKLAAPGANLVLSGPGGVGKTSLAVQALSLMMESDAGLHVVHFAATASTQASPLAVFTAVLSDDAAFASETPDRVAKAILSSATQQASQNASRKPSVAQLVIMIDDVALLDNMSALVLDYLISRTDVRVVLTARSDSGLGAALTRAWRDGVLERIEVPVLGEVEVSEIAGQMLAPHNVSPEMLSRLTQVSGGNALFLVELVHSLVRSESLQLKHGYWVWRSPLAADTSLADIVAAELSHLTRQQRGAFETLALCAPVPLRLIGAHLDQQLLSELAEQRLITFEGRASSDTVVCLAHPVFGEVIAAQLNPAQIMGRYCELYDAAFSQLRVVPGGDAHASQLAGSPRVDVKSAEPSLILSLVQWGIGGSCVVPLELLLRAYEIVHVLPDYSYRITLASALLQHPHSDDAVRVTALNNRIDAYRFSNDPDGVARDAQTAQSIIERMPLSADRSALAVDHGLAVAEALVLQEGRWREGLEVLDWSEQLASEGEAYVSQRKRIDIARGIYLGYGGKMRESVGLQRALYTEMHSSADFLPLASTLIISLAQRGELQRARSVARQQMALAVRSVKQHPLAIGDLVGAWCLADLIAGNVREASLVFTLLNAAIARNPGRVRVRRTLIAFGRGLVAISNGEWNTAVVQLKIACAELEDFTGTGSEGLLLTSLALAQAATGDHRGAAENRARFEALQEQSSALLELPARYNLLLASLYAPQGNEAREARALASLARTRGFALMEIRALHGLALSSRGRIDDSDLARARELADQIASPLATLLLRSCEHIAQGGDQNLGHEARALARRGLFIPPQALSSELTERENQLAQLLALGFSNNQIAARLFISRRTVESHAAKVMHKLRVASRDDVADALAALE